MGTLLVVEPEVGPQPRLQLWHTLILLDVYVFVFHAPPQPLHEHVVQRPPPTVPAHRDPGLLQAVGVLPRRELRSLVGVEDLRPAHRQRLLERLQAEPPLQRVRQPPREHVPAVPVDHCRQVHEAMPHRHIRDVRTPNLVDAGQHPIAEQVGVDPRLRCRRGGPRPGEQRLQAHHSHEPLDPLAIDRLPGTLQTRRHPPAAVERGLEELLVDQPHQAQVFLRLGGRWEIVARSVEAQEFALSTDAQMTIRWFDQGPLEVSRRGQLFFFNHSTSILSRPICSYSSAWIAWLSSWSRRRPSRIRDSMPSRSCFGSSVFKCTTSQKAPSGPWRSGGSARSTSRSLPTPDSGPRSTDSTNSGRTSGAG